MIVIDKLLISEDVVEKQFVCDLNKCKGGCCEEGDAGAPLEDAELKIIETVFEKVKPFLTPEGLAEIEKKGLKEYDTDFGWVTPTIGSSKGICVYAYKDETHTIKCAFEKAYNDGIIDWKKPISCHLYPITTKQGAHGDYERVNYEPREILCSTGCAFGEKLKVPVYQFLKEPIIRKWGQEVYDALDTIAKGEWQEIDFKE
ncbi:MAG: hypothetical protein RIR12_1620 [Bacteroidota bacterium]